MDKGLLCKAQVSTNLSWVNNLAKMNKMTEGREKVNKRKFRKDHCKKRVHKDHYKKKVRKDHYKKKERKDHYKKKVHKRRAYKDLNKKN